MNCHRFNFQTAAHFARHTSAISPRIRASFTGNVLPSNQRAQGMPGARSARSLACSVKNTRVSHHGHTGFTRHSPRNGFTAYFVLSPVTGLVCHRRQRNTECQKPGRADMPSVNLTPASGRQDHTTSPSALAPFVSAPLTAHGKPALPPGFAPDAARVHRIPRPTSVTIAKRPSEGARRREL